MLFCVSLANNAEINEDLPAPLGADKIYKLPCDINFPFKIDASIIMPKIY